MPRDLLNELKQSKPFRNLEEEAFINLLRTGGIVAGRMSGLLKKHRLSLPLYNILRILRGAGEAGIPCGEIAERMVTREPDVTRLIDRIQRLGWARRRRSDEDRRVVLVRATHKGVGLVEKLEAPIQELLQRTLGHLTRSELRELNRLLAKARDFAPEA